MTSGSPALLLLALGLGRRGLHATRREVQHTHNSVLLQCRCTPIENEYWLYPIEQQLADATEKAKDMSVHQCTTVFVTHGGLELVYPYTRIDCQDLAFHVLQAWIKRCKHGGLPGLARTLTEQGALLVPRGSIATLHPCFRYITRLVLGHGHKLVVQGSTLRSTRDEVIRAREPT